MAKASSRDGVIDPQHRVKGVNGLRIVDLSIFVRAAFNLLDLTTI